MTTEQTGVSRRGLLAAEKAGRGGDRVLGHLTPGELVVPKSCQSAELMALFAQLAHEKGMDPNRYIVGSEEAHRNPKTGLEEFDDGGDGEGGGGPGDGGDSDADGGSTGGANGGVSSDNAAPGGARDTPGTGDPDNSNSASGYGTNGEGPGTSGSLGYGGVVDGVANLGERAMDSLSVDGRNAGVLGMGIGMVAPGPVGLGVSYGREAVEAIGGMLDNALSSVGLESSDKGFSSPGDPGGTAGGTDSRFDQSSQIRQRARRGLLPSRRA